VRGEKIDRGRGDAVGGRAESVVKVDVQAHPVTGRPPALAAGSVVLRLLDETAAGAPLDEAAARVGLTVAVARCVVTSPLAKALLAG
jgi:hypothetical protein